MHELVVLALEHQDYQRAAQLLKQWRRATPQEPLLLLYGARLQEATQQWEAAEKTYLQFLRQVNHPKLMGQAREGLKRVQDQRQALRDQAWAEAVNGDTDPGVLVLAPPADRQTAALQLAQIFRLDPYTARLQLPGRGLRLQRIGPMGELQYYGESLRAANIPADWLKLDAIKTLQTFQVRHFRQLHRQPAIVCQNPAGQVGTLAFEWSEVTQRVVGQLPIFEQVVDLGPWGKLQHKQKTQDYAKVLDLHLHGRNIMLRLCDRTYEFAKGAPAIALPETASSLTAHHQWQALVQHINQQVSSPIHSDFESFGQGALEFIDLLPFLNPQLDLDRRAPSNWDQAFHLYSGLRFWQATG
jgi:hypothetical protein